MGIARRLGPKIHFAHLRNVRREGGRADAVIPMRPDHGQDILTDIGRGAQPGYPATGRLKGLAEPRGGEWTLARY